MEISIRRDEKDQNAYAVTIGHKTIQTLWANEYHADSIVKEWVREINKAYCKKKRQTLVVGLSADRSTNYAKGSSYDYYNRHTKIKDPLEVLQLCVGQHCLIYELPRPYDRDPAPKALRDLLHDNRTVAVGVGIEKVAKKIEEDYGLMVARPVELRGLAEVRNGSGLEKLAKVVLGEEWDVVKPASMEWWKVRLESLSDDKIKYGTVDAFLACEMGSKLLKDC